MSSDDRCEISALSDISQQAHPPLCSLFEVSLVRCVPHAACSCCRLFYKSKCQASLPCFFGPVPLSHVTLQDPKVQRKTSYSIHGITGGEGAGGGWSSLTHHGGVILFTGIKHGCSGCSCVRGSRRCG